MKTQLNQKNLLATIPLLGFVFFTTFAGTCGVPEGSMGDAVDAAATITIPDAATDAGSRDGGMGDATPDASSFRFQSARLCLQPSHAGTPLIASTSDAVITEWVTGTYSTQSYRYRTAFTIEITYRYRGEQHFSTHTVTLDRSRFACTSAMADFVASTTGATNYSDIQFDRINVIGHRDTSYSSAPQNYVQTQTAGSITRFELIRDDQDQPTQRLEMTVRAGF